MAAAPALMPACARARAAASPPSSTLRAATPAQAAAIPSVVRGTVSALEENLRPQIFSKWEAKKWRHATTILRNEFPKEWRDVKDLLSHFWLGRSEIVEPGKNKTAMSKRIDFFLYERGWAERSFDVSITVDADIHPSPTYSIDCSRNRVGLEIEWNNKDPFFDRDLNNFRLLHSMEVLSVGIIVTRSSDLNELIKELGRWKSFGKSTTHMNKLRPKIEGGGAGGFPLLFLGITKGVYDANALENDP